VYFAHAQTLLQQSLPMQGRAVVLAGFDLLQAELARRRTDFESWALHHAQQIFALPMHAAERRQLRDWLDAYRFFGIPVFADDPAAWQFVLAMSNS
jgi:hypothetical protein